jgi:hypothetical protein
MEWALIRLLKRRGVENRASCQREWQGLAPDQLILWNVWGWEGWENMRLRRETVLGFCRSFESAAQLTSSGLALRSSSLFGFHSAISQIQHWKELNWNRPINSPFKTGIPKTNVLGPGTPFPPVRTVEIWAKLKFPSCEGVKHPTRN